MDLADIYCLAFCEELDKGAKATWSNLSKGGTLKKAWAFQPVSAFQASSWLIGCDLTDKKTPRVVGYLKVADKVLSWSSEGENELDLYAAFPENGIKIGRVRYRLSSDETKELLNKVSEYPTLQKSWKTGDAIIPLSDLL